MLNFANRLKNWRMELGLTFEEAGKLADVFSGEWENWENDKKTITEEKLFFLWEKIVSEKELIVKVTEGGCPVDIVFFRSFVSLVVFMQGVCAVVTYLSLNDSGLPIMKKLKVDMKENKRACEIFQIWHDAFNSK